MPDNFQCCDFDTKSKFSWIDVETQNLCLNYRLNLPWQIGIIDVVNGKIVKEQDIMVNWGRDFVMSQDAARITRYNQDEVNRRGIQPEEAWEKLNHTLNNTDYFCGHNILGFDYFLLNSFYKKLGKEVFDFSKLKGIIDTLAIARGVALNIQPNPNEDLLLYSYKMLNKRSKGIKLTLGALAKQHNIETDENMLHDALYDLKININVWNKLKYQVNF